MNSKPFVNVVDDDPSIRDSLSLLLKAVGHRPRVFENAQSFLDQYDASQPGCLILDVRMPGMDGLQLQWLLAERAPALPIIMFTAHGDLPMAVDAMRSGAWHFVEKPYDKDRLLGIIENALESDRQWRMEHAEQSEIESRLATLTGREREVMEQLVDGKGTKGVALALGTSPNTVAHQRAKILEKMHAESVVDLTRMILLLRGESQP